MELERKHHEEEWLRIQEEQFHRVEEQSTEELSTTFIVLLIVGTFFTLAYIFLGFSNIPVAELSAPLVSAESFVPSCDGVCGTVESESYVTIPLSVVTFIIATLCVFGWVLFVIFGGIGLAALPVDLINAFRERPNPISDLVYKERVIRIGERAEELIKQGIQLQDKTISFNRKEKNEWKTQVWVLSKEYDMNEIAFHKKGGPIIIYYLQLVVGIIGVILSVLWVVQICVWTNTATYPFINYMFIVMDGIWQFFGVLFFWYLCLLALMVRHSRQLQMGHPRPTFLYHTSHETQRNFNEFDVGQYHLNIGGLSGCHTLMCRVFFRICSYNKCK